MIPPLLLILIAFIQTLVVERFHLNKWKGGGFAMFSTVDHYSNRFLRTYVPTTEGDLPALLSDWDNWRLRLICMPNTSILKKEADQKDSEVWNLLHPGMKVMEDPVDFPDRNEMRAFQRVYGESDSKTAEATPAYSAFLVSASQLQQPTETVTATGPSRVDAYRLIYRGEGRITGKLISSSEDRDH